MLRCNATISTLVGEQTCWRAPKWHNPFVCSRHGTRSQVSEKFQKYLRSNASLWSSLHELDGKRLRCHCSAHLDCHIDVLIRAWSEKNNVRNGENEVICGLVTQKQHVFEIFCGHAGVASAVIDLGHVARAVDWHGNKFKPVFPVFNMDLTQHSQQQCLLRDLDVGCPTFVWMSPPCASALSAADESLAWKLERDDTLIQYCAQLWEWCRGKGVQVAIENARARCLGRHLCGCVFAQRRVLARLRCSNVCMFGASRDKWSKIVSTSDKLAPLAKTCDKSHAHEHWSEAHFQRSLRGAGGGYPVGLCQAIAACICGQEGGQSSLCLSHNQMTFLRPSASSIAQH